ncbi:hypothetical protein DUB27_20280 [Salmonella enterica subsp. enterica serovar Kandla]|nr:hypothetical protein [Salmonella enterica subsp. enterica serovar Kandla]
MGSVFMIRKYTLHNYEIIIVVLIITLYSICLFNKAEWDGERRYKEIEEKSEQFWAPDTIYYQNILNKPVDYGETFYHGYCNNTCDKNEYFSYDTNTSHHYLYQTGMLDQRDYFF